MLNQYIYISRAKLAVYLPQVLEDSFFRKDGEKVVIDLGFDLKFINGKFSIEQQPFEGCVPALKLVEKYIVDRHQPQAPDSGNDWIAGEMDVRFIRIGKDKDAFALIGKYSDYVILLIGSNIHTQFSDKPQTIDTGYSHFPFVEEILINHCVEMAETSNIPFLEAYLSFDETRNINGRALGDFEMAANIYEMFSLANRTLFRVKFLARRLFLGESTRMAAKMCAMYSPLYVIHE